MQEIEVERVYSPGKIVFKLSESFIEDYKNKQPEWGPLGYVTYKRTYARTKDDNTTEEFWETLRRVVEGTYSIQKHHCKNLGLPWSDSKAQRSAQEMFRRMWEMKFLPPGRGLWAMGTYIIEKIGSAALQNCAFTSTKDINIDFSAPFIFLMDMSMLGVGVGFDALGTGSITIKSPKIATTPFVVEDTREGWVSLIQTVLKAYSGQDKLPLEIDTSRVREEGELIKTFGGVAAGPKPLLKLVEEIKEILEPLVDKKITSSAIVDIMNVIGKCVVAGNVRRTAELALGEINDDEFLNLKNPDLYRDELMNHRWASNNSVFARIGDDYSKVAELTAMNGEPGYAWLENCRNYGRIGDNGRVDYRVAGLNPCAEQTLEDRELCCLVETFPSRHETLEDYKKTLKFAYLYAKTVTLVPTHDERSNAVIMRNRRIGTSQSGIVQGFQKFGRREYLRWCDEGYKYIRNLDEEYSDWMCIPKSIKVTTVKPSGTVSLLPGVTPGIHYPHAQYYYRTIRFKNNSPLLVSLKKANYRIEDDQYSPDTSVVYFPVEEEFFDRCKADVSMWEQLENAAQLNQYWSDNAVSATITFSKDEGKDIGRALELYETRLKTVSFLPLEDHGYEQAPYQEITKSEFYEYKSSLKKINWKMQDTHELQDIFCDGETCLLV